MGFPNVYASAFRAETLKLNYLLPAQVRFLAVCALCQADFESDGFSSSVFLQTNNCIGYKYVPGSRWQSGHSPKASTEGDYYAKYESVEKCAGELANWIFRRGRLFKDLGSLAEYVHKLKQCGYFGSAEALYLRGCERFYPTAYKITAS